MANVKWELQPPGEFFLKAGLDLYQMHAPACAPPIPCGLGVTGMAAYKTQTSWLHFCHQVTALNDHDRADNTACPCKKRNRICTIDPDQWESQTWKAPEKWSPAALSPSVLVSLQGGFPLCAQLCTMEETRPQARALIPAQALLKYFIFSTSSTFKVPE